MPAAVSTSSSTSALPTAIVAAATTVASNTSAIPAASVAAATTVASDGVASTPTAPVPASPPPAPQPATHGASAAAQKSKRKPKKKAIAVDVDAAGVGAQPPPQVVPKKWHDSALFQLEDNKEEYFGHRTKVGGQKGKDLNAKLNARISNLIGRTCNFNLAYLGTTIENPLGKSYPRLPNTLVPLPYTPLSEYDPKDQAFESNRRLTFCKRIHEVCAHLLAIRVPSDVSARLLSTSRHGWVTLRARWKKSTSRSLCGASISSTRLSQDRVSI
jgi:hypothetical protein